MPSLEPDTGPELTTLRSRQKLRSSRTLCQRSPPGSPEESALYFDLCVLGGMAGFISSPAEVLFLGPSWWTGVGGGGQDSDAEIISS